MFLYVLIAFIALLISIGICNFFATCAEDKGYSKSTYFWICFFFGVLGYAWVAALPDAAMRHKIANLEKQISHLQPANTHAAPVNHSTPRFNVNTTPSNNGWTCSCGRSHAGYVSSCPCGVNKRDIAK